MGFNIHLLVHQPQKSIDEEFLSLPPQNKREYAHLRVVVQPGSVCQPSGPHQIFDSSHPSPSSCVISCCQCLHMVQIAILTLDYKMSWSSDQENSSGSLDLDTNPQRSRLQSIWHSIKASKAMGERYRESIRADPIPLHRPSPDSSPSPRSQSRRERKGETTQLALELRRAREHNKQLEFELQQVKREGRGRVGTSMPNQASRASRGRELRKQNQHNNTTQHTVIEQYQAQIDRLTLRVRALEQENKHLEEEVTRLTQITQLQSRQHTSQQEEGAQCVVEGTGEQLLELSEARQTITRLVELLRHHGSREDWAWLGEGKEMHYLKNIMRRARRGELEGFNSKTGCGCGSKLGGEKVLWSPTECYRIMLELKMKYDYLSEDCIEEVLFQMNKIYGVRQQTVVQQLKGQYTQQLAQLKRKNQENYNEALAKKQITRLKKELRTAKSTQKVKGKLEGLKDRGEYEDQLRLRERELRLLRERMKLLQVEQGANQKGLYYQGVVWGVEKLLSELGEAEGSLKQFQVQFRQRLDDCLDVQDWLRSYKDFFEALTEHNHALVERLLTIKQTALGKMVPIRA